MVSDEARENRRLIEQDEQQRQREQQSQRRPPDPAAPGTIGHAVKAQKALRAAMNRAPDLRSSARLEVDRIWANARAACLERFGRAPSCVPHEQASDELVLSLSAAEDAEGIFLREANAPGADPSFVAAARETFGARVLQFVNLATRGWPSAVAYRRQQAEHARTW